MPTLNNSTMSSDANHRTILKSIDVDSARRHSPNASESGEASTFRGIGRDSPGGSPNPNQALFSSATAPNLSASPHGRYGHRPRNSTDSVSSNAAIYGSGVPADASQVLRNQMNISDMIGGSRPLDISRRYGQDGGRPSPQDSGDRSAGTEPPGSAKDSKSFLSFLSRKKKQKEDGTFPSPEELGDSPTSPAVNFKPQSLGSRAGNASETSLDRPGSSFSTQDHGAPFRSRRITSGRIFVLATIDYWNYRMLDVTDVDTASELRHLICSNFSLSDVEGAEIYLTELGKFDHEDPLDDMKLLTNKKLKADSAGTLKLFIKPSGVGSNLGDLTNLGRLSPAYMAPGAMDEDTYARLNGQRTRSSSSPPTSRQNTISGERTKEDGDTLAQQANAYKAEIERKQQEYLAKRRQAAAKDSPQNEGLSYGIVASRNVNFDEPRHSPFEDKRFADNLLPQRKAPAAPVDPSATLIKANSLSRKSGDRLRLSQGSLDGYPTKRPGPPTESPQQMTEKRKPVPPAQALGGIGAALAGIGRNLGGIGLGHQGAGARAISPNRVASSPIPNSEFYDRGKDSMAGCSIATLFKFLEWNID